jgi:xylulokinase
MWHFMGVMLSAAGSLQWYRDTLAPSMSFDELLKEAESIPAGSEGLQFLPYLSGERTPHPDPLARGAFIGLTIRHSRAHMTRAVLEGVAFGLKDSLTLIQNAGLVSITQMRASGGGTKGALWRQILASVLEAELVTVNTTEGAAYGTALLAGVGAGAWTDVFSASRECIRITGSMQPMPEEVNVYRQAYPVYQALYPALRSSFERMGGMV